MSTKEFIESGILESYILGFASVAEIQKVEDMIAVDSDVRQELHEISIAFEKFALANAIEPDPIIKPFLMATIDYSDRIKNGEVVMSPPALNEASTADDFKLWLSREDMVLPDEASDVFAKIIGNTPEAITAIVWLRSMAPQEAHDNEFERFLIVEGSCEITIEEKVHQLNAGDYLQIPLHKNHHVQVTSKNPCKIILQRVAA